MEIVCNRDKPLGRGRYGVVFEGTLCGKPVAVKRVQLIDVEDIQIEEDLKTLNHPNVVKLLHSVGDMDFRYYALELCVATLDQCYLTDQRKYHGPLPCLEDILIQLAAGLQYIHGNQFVHRDLKPENILIWVADPTVKKGNENKQILLKLSDFGLCKRTKESGSFSMSGIKGTRNWLAPELQQFLEMEYDDKAEPPRGKIQSDIFALGLVFAYVLLQGKHPYGTGLIIATNLSKNNPVNLNEIPKKYKMLRRKLIDKMLKTNPSARLEARKIVQILKEHFESNIKGKEINQKSSDLKCVYLKNVKYGEYLYSTDDQPVDFNHYRVFTWRRTYEGPASKWGKTWGNKYQYQGVWIIEKEENCPEYFTIKSAYYRDHAQPLYAVPSNDPTFVDPSRRPVYTYRGGDSLPNRNGDLWKIETVPGFSDRVRIKYTNTVKKLDEYLYAAIGAFTFDKDRRNVFTWSSEKVGNIDTWEGVGDWIIENADCPTINR